MDRIRDVVAAVVVRVRGITAWWLRASTEEPLEGADRVIHADGAVTVDVGAEKGLPARGAEPESQVVAFPTRGNDQLPIGRGCDDGAAASRRSEPSDGIASGIDLAH